MMMSRAALRRLLVLMVVVAIFPALQCSAVDPLKQLLAGGSGRLADVASAENSVVKIETIFESYSHSSPWLPSRMSRAGGTGFIIEGNRILTNAHVVSQAVSIRVSRSGQGTSYEAKLRYIAHDSDLALLEVEEDEFFDGARELRFGSIPELNSEVVVIGYPIGGDRVSITRGVVSRIDLDVYSHSQVDAHMILQVDAAINPGNSGGPALQGGRVIGVAFQILSRGENLGYLIPTPVVDRFLKDIADGEYDGYTELGVVTQPTINPVLREAIGITGALRRQDTGVLIYRILPDSAADGYLRPGDILLRLQGHAISESGDVNYQGRELSYVELVDHLLAGELIEAEVLRNGELIEVKFAARATGVVDFMRRNFETPPSYLLLAGLLFQPVNADLMEAMGREWSTSGLEIIYRYQYFILHELWQESRQDVVLTRRLADPVNQLHDPWLQAIVRRVNGVTIEDFPAFVREIDRAMAEESRLVIEFRNRPLPLVIDTVVAHEASRRVESRYRIGADRSVIEAGQ